MARRWIPRACFAVFPLGIAGLIVASINGNNNGVVLTIGAVTTTAAVVLLVVSAVATDQRIEAFAEADAESLETSIAELVAGGADEARVRRLVRDARRTGSR
jgi:hypothetical protein